MPKPCNGTMSRYNFGDELWAVIEKLTSNKEEQVGVSLQRRPANIERRPVHA